MATESRSDDRGVYSDEFRRQSDGNYVLYRWRLSESIKVTKRADLRNCWEVDGVILSTKDAAYEHARAMVNKAEAETDVDTTTG